MSKRFALMFFLTALFLCSMPVLAQEKTEAATTEENPPVGPPPQMKEIAYLVGVWDVDMKMRMSDTATTFTDTKGVCRYESILDGSVMEMTYEGQFMGMNFKGFGLQCFNRETGKWQSVWSDNISSCMSLYEGEKKDAILTLTGVDRYQGMEFLTRISTFNETPTRFEWKMEHSMDGGKTYLLSATAVYTKRN